jgi:hypothetical protein
MGTNNCRLRKKANKHSWTPPPKAEAVKKRLIIWNNDLSLQSFGGASFERFQTLTLFRPEDLAR